MTMQKYELSAEQQEEVERFVAEESVNVAAAEARNKKRRPKDRKVSMNTIKEFIRENEWPRCDIAKDWLHSADPTQKVGLAAGVITRTDSLLHPGNSNYRKLLLRPEMQPYVAEMCRLSCFRYRDGALWTAPF